MIVRRGDGLLLFVDVESLGLLHDDFLLLGVLRRTAVPVLAAHVQSALRVLGQHTALINAPH